MALLDARAARDRAVSEGASAAGLSAGDTELQQGQEQRRAGRRAAAFEHLRTASNLFVTAESVATAAHLASRRAITPVDTPKVAPPSVDTPTAPENPEPAIRQTIGDFAHAIETRRLDELQRVFPDISQSQAESYRQFFAGAADIHADWKATRIDPTVDQAVAHVSLTLTFKRADSHAPDRTESELTMLLVRRRGTWVVTAIR
jgi:hypothetical protein